MTTGRETRGRILTVLNYYSPYVSGLSEYARLVAEGAVQRGFSVTVLTGRHDARLPEREVLHGVSVVRARPLLFLHKGYLSVDLFRRFRVELRGADVAHFHLPMLECGALASLAGATPLVATYHCDVARSGSGRLLDAAAVRAVYASCRRCLRHARRIAVSSRDYAAGSEVLRGTESQWVEIAPPDKGSRIPPEEAPRAPGALRVGFLGRFVEEKGIDVLLDAAPLVLRHLPDTRFLLAGNAVNVAGGSEYARLRGRIEALGGSLEMPGHIAEEQLQSFYASLDAFVLPSVSSYEAFGMVQVEAMKAGVPVVASDMRGVRVPVGKTGNGLLVAPRDGVALAGAIVRVLSEPRFRARREIFDRATAAFPPDAAVDRYCQLYTDLRAGR